MVVSKSLCGFVTNQVQNNMEGAQYQGYYIIIINKYIIDLYIKFHSIKYIKTIIYISSSSTAKIPLSASSSVPLGNRTM